MRTSNARRRRELQQCDSVAGPGPLAYRTSRPRGFAQSISYTFGSKIANGYFVQQNSVCRVTLMIAEKTDPDLPSPTAARVRVMLDPGQVVGFDSDEGRSISLTCGEDAATLVVSYGERAKLIALQGLAVTSTIAERVQREAGRIGSPSLAHQTSE
jgi:hypothetical protein